LGPHAHPRRPPQREAKLTVLAIWLPMLAGDSRDAWDSNILDDPRVISYWDGDRIAGNWFGDHAVGDVGGGGGYAVWDAYFAFPESSRWDGVPSGVVAAGSNIIDHSGALDDRFVPLLRA
jgi:hypothetical protein